MKLNKIFMVMIVFVFSFKVSAAEWSSTNVQLLYGSGFRMPPKPETTQQRITLTFENVSDWAYGENFIFFDYALPLNKEDSASLFGKFSPSLSISKMAGKDLSFSIFKDYLLSASIKMGSDFVWLLGGGASFKIPHFQYLKLYLFLKDTIKEPGATAQISLVWSLPIEIKHTKLEFGGFLDLTFAEGKLKTNIIIGPQLLLDIGNYWGKPDLILAGLEYSYWYKKFGLDFSESVFQPMLKWVF